MPGPSTAPVYRAPGVFSTTALDAVIARERAALPPGKKLRVTAAITTEGARLTALRQWTPHVYAGGYAERQWGGRGWTAGAQAVYTQ